MISALVEEYCDNYSWFITLTFKRSEKNINKVNKILHAMFTQLREKCFGRRIARHINGSSDIMCFGSIERHADGFIHIHLLLKKPSVSLLLQAKNKNVGVQASKYLEDFWVRRKSLGYIVEIIQLQTNKDKRKAMNYLLKKTSSKNSNYFIAHWDSNKEVMATDCAA